MKLRAVKLCVTLAHAPVGAAAAGGSAAGAGAPTGPAVAFAALLAAQQQEEKKAAEPAAGAALPLHPPLLTEATLLVGLRAAGASLPKWAAPVSCLPPAKSMLNDLATSEAWAAASEYMMNFALRTRNCASKTRSCVSKARNFAFKLMDFAARTAEEELEASFRAVISSVMGLLDENGDKRLSLQEFLRLDELLVWGCGGSG